MHAADKRLEKFSNAYDCVNCAFVMQDSRDNRTFVVLYDISHLKIIVLHYFGNSLA